MRDLALLAGLAYLGYIAYLGVKGGQKALEPHLFMMWTILIVGGILAAIFY
jgi:hypothetical protein